MRHYKKFKLRSLKKKNELTYRLKYISGSKSYKEIS